jgi:Leucine-rich repeat (LRR) protein
MPSRVTVVLVSLLLATPAVIFWLWLVTLPARVVIKCPEECRCHGTEGYYLNCSDSGLNSIPSVLPTHVQALGLDGNNITFLENDSFVSRGLVELLEIEARFCKIRKIELRAFNGLAKLKLLLIEGNEISEIIPGTFEKNSHLKVLHLLNNRIENLESDVFCGLVELEDIDLKGNKLQYIHPDTFSGLPYLQKLILSKNSGLQIATDRHFINSHSLK